MSVLVCNNLSKTNLKNEEIIKNFSYNFLDNQIYTIIGKHDFYQDELLSLISCQNKASSGCVYLDGQPLYKNNLMNERLCYISQDISFPFFFKIKDVFELYENYYPKWDVSYAYELINHFNISINSFFGKLPKNKQSLVIGILGLASRANITIYNNPVENVDLKDRYDFFNFLYQHHQQFPRTFIIATSFVDEIDFLIDKVLFFDKGRLFSQFSVDELKDGFRYLSGKTEVLKSLIGGVKIIGIEERENTLTICIRQKLSKDDIRKYQKYLIKISSVPIQNIYIYLINLREKKVKL